MRGDRSLRGCGSSLVGTAVIEVALPFSSRWPGAECLSLAISTPRGANRAFSLRRSVLELRARRNERLLHVFYTRDFELNGVFIATRIDWSYRILGAKLMYEWMLVRFAMLAALVGGGVLLAFAGGALDRWRERRARARRACQDEVLAAEYGVNPTRIDRGRERGARRGGASGSGIASANHRASLTSIKTGRSSAH